MPCIPPVFCLLHSLHRHRDMALYLNRSWRLLSFSSSISHRLLCTSVSSSLLPQIEPSKEADTLTQILIQQHNPFHALESSLQLHGISLSPPLLTQVLLRLRHHSKISLSLFHFSLSLPSPPLNLPSFNLVIDSLSRVRQFDVVWDLITLTLTQHQPSNSNDRFIYFLPITPSPSTFYILIRRLIAAGLTRQALRAFDDIGVFVEGYEPWNDGYGYLLDTLCKYGYVRLASEVFNSRRNSGVFEPDVKLYTVLIYGWCKIKRVDVAERFLNEMIELGIEPNSVTYNVLLNGICRRASLHPDERFERTLRAADKVFDEMRDRGIEPDITSYSIVLHVYSRAHKAVLCLDKLREMKERGICPSPTTYTSVIKCLCSCGRIGDAEVLMEEMVRNGVSPCAAMYNCFFKEYRGRKDVASAVKLYRKMKGNNDGDNDDESNYKVMCAPTLQTYNILISMFVKLDHMRLVREIWEDMKISGVGPDLDSYTLLIHELCAKEKWREACRLFVEMIETGFLPQTITFETLYRGLIQSDKLRTWRRLKKKLEEESVTFGSEFKNYHLKPYRR